MNVAYSIAWVRVSEWGIEARSGSRPVSTDWAKTILGRDVFLPHVHFVFVLINTKNAKPWKLVSTDWAKTIFRRDVFLPDEYFVFVLTNTNTKP